MYEVIKAAIEAGEYPLENMLHRIRTFAARGLITDTDMSQLESLARQHASLRADTDLLAKIAELEGRIRALEAGEKVETDPAYVPGKWYWRGDRVTENGVSYVCIAPENVVCTWSPSDYPAYWEQAQ